MSLLLALYLFWIGIGAPIDVADEIQDIVIEQIADPAERWRPLVAEHFPAEEVDTAICIIGYESNGDPEAENPRSSATGLFQILASLWGPHFGVSSEELLDPETNTRLARRVWDESGWWAWSPYQSGNCR